MRKIRTPFDENDGHSLNRFTDWLSDQQAFRIVGSAAIDDLDPIAMWLRSAAHCEITLARYYVLFFRKGQLRRYALLPLWCHAVRTAYQQPGTWDDEHGSLRADTVLVCIANYVQSNRSYKIGDEVYEYPF